MQVKLLAFATAAESLGWREMVAECISTDTPRSVLLSVAPGLDFEKCRVAVNGEYHSWDEPIGMDAGEIAIIPPVSGG